MSLDIREMILGQICKMRYVYRFQGCRVYDRESIAEHTGYVMIYSDFIARYCESTREVVDYRKLMHRSAVHDMEEVVTGDFPRPYKYGNDKLRAALEEAAPRAFLDVVHRVFHGSTEHRFVATLLEDWKDAKDDSLEGCIIRVADYLSALSFIVQEVQAGNNSMRTHNWTLRKGIELLREKVPPVLQPVVMQVEAIVQEYLA